MWIDSYHGFMIALMPVGEDETGATVVSNVDQRGATQNFLENVFEQISTQTDLTSDGSIEWKGEMPRKISHQRIQTRQRGHSAARDFGLRTEYGVAKLASAESSLPQFGGQLKQAASFLAIVRDGFGVASVSVIRRRTASPPHQPGCLQGHLDDRARGDRR
jgi:hypothetical protein